MEHKPLLILFIRPVLRYCNFSELILFLQALVGLTFFKSNLQNLPYLGHFSAVIGRLQEVPDEKT